MSHVFLYEYVTGGGTFSAQSPDVPAGSLLQEGTAMIHSLAEDFLRVPGVQVSLLHDTRLPSLRLASDIPPPVKSDTSHTSPKRKRGNGLRPSLARRACVISGRERYNIVDIGDAQAERRAIHDLADQADWTVLIAPEFDGILLDRCRWVESAGARLLSPPSTFVELTADKNRTAEQLRQHGIPMPKDTTVHSGQRLPSDFPYPAVVKPCDGAGSLGVQLVVDNSSNYEIAFDAQTTRLEEFRHGTPASVAVLCGPCEAVALPACSQRVSKDGRFRYLGGHGPLTKALSQRAQRLGLAAVEALPPAVGHVGVDLVLGDDINGRDDVVIEVNPRLTTSYVGLRAMCRTNLAAAMMAVARGDAAELSFSEQTVEFDADGQVRV